MDLIGSHQLIIHTHNIGTQEVRSIPLVKALKISSDLAAFAVDFMSKLPEFYTYVIPLVVSMKNILSCSVSAIVSIGTAVLGEKIKSALV